MKRVLRIVSVVTLVVASVGVSGQALVVALGIFYTPTGQPVNPTLVALIVTYMAGVGLYLSFLLCPVTGILGFATMALRKQYRWIAALVVAGILSLAGLFGMIWILLSSSSPIALITPLALIPFTTFIYSLQADPQTP